MGEIYNSGIAALNEVFQKLFDDNIMKKGDSAKSPAQIAKDFPIEIIPYEYIFEVLYQTLQKKTYGHYGCFFENMFHNGHIQLKDFREIVCFRGEVYEYCTRSGDRANTFTCHNGEWRERKLYQDIQGKWHLWDGRHGIEIWTDEERRVFTTNPPVKPNKIYPAE